MAQCCAEAISNSPQTGFVVVKGNADGGKTWEYMNPSNDEEIKKLNRLLGFGGMTLADIPTGKQGPWDAVYVDWQLQNPE